MGITHNHFRLVRDAEHSQPLQMGKGWAVLTTSSGGSGVGSTHNLFRWVTGGSTHNLFRWVRGGQPSQVFSCLRVRQHPKQVWMFQGPRSHTAKTKYRYFETNIPRKYWGLSPNFHIHASVSDLYIPTIGLPILLEEICRPILGLYISLTHT